MSTRPLTHKPKPKAVRSSNIKSVGYDADAMTMEIKFKTGGHYVYHNVTPEQHQQLISAPSIGAHFHKHIKMDFKVTKL